MFVSVSVAVSMAVFVLYLCSSHPISVSEMLFLFVSFIVCCRFCLFLFLFLLLGITVGNPICVFVSRDRGAKRPPPPSAVGGSRGPWGPRPLGILVST